MNGELHTLFWYTRAELVLLRRKISSLLSKKCIDLPSSRTEVAQGNEFDNIMCGIIQTLDDILETEAVLWNTIFLSHIIQSLTVHLSNLRAVQDAATLQSIAHLPLDIDFVRIYCFVETLVAVSRANLIVLCTGPPKAGTSTCDISGLKGNFLVSPMYQNRYSCTNQKSGKTNLKIKTSSKSLSNVERKTTTSPILGEENQIKETFNIPTTSRVRNKDPLRQSRSNKDLSLLILEDKIDQSKRLATKVTSKEMLLSHDTSIEAMSNSVHDTGAGLPVHNSEFKSVHVEKRYIAKPKALTRWRAANNVIRTLVHLPRSLGH